MNYEVVVTGQNLGGMIFIPLRVELQEQARGLVAIARTPLFAHRGDVLVDGVLGYAQRKGNLLAGLVLREMFKHPALSGRQLIQRADFCEH